MVYECQLSQETEVMWPRVPTQYLCTAPSDSPTVASISMVALSDALFALFIHYCEGMNIKCVKYFLRIFIVFPKSVKSNFDH